jgi:hypothetical protein
VKNAARKVAGGVGAVAGHVARNLPAYALAGATAYGGYQAYKARDSEAAKLLGSAYRGAKAVGSAAASGVEKAAGAANAAVDFAKEMRDFDPNKIGLEDPVRERHRMNNTKPNPPPRKSQPIDYYRRRKDAAMQDLAEGKPVMERYKPNVQEGNGGQMRGRSGRYQRGRGALSSSRQGVYM